MLLSAGAQWEAAIAPAVSAERPKLALTQRLPLALGTAPKKAVWTLVHFSGKAATPFLKASTTTKTMIRLQAQAKRLLPEPRVPRLPGSKNRALTRPRSLMMRMLPLSTAFLSLWLAVVSSLLSSCKGTEMLF